MINMYYIFIYFLSQKITIKNSLFLLFFNLVDGYIYTQNIFSNHNCLVYITLNTLSGVSFLGLWSMSNACSWPATYAWHDSNHL